MLMKGELALTIDSSDDNGRHKIGDGVAKWSELSYALPVPSSAAPLVAGAASAGTNNGKYAREGHIHPLQTSVSGNAGTATKLANKRTIGLTGVTATAQDFDGTADVTIPITAIPQSVVTGLTTDLAGKAPLASPALTGTPTAPTASAGTNTTQLATTAFVKTAVDNKTTITGNAGTATKLATPRQLKIGDAGKNFDGSAAVEWTLSEIGAVSQADFNAHKDKMPSTGAAGGGHVILPPGSENKYLKDNGTWEAPPNTTYSVISDAETDGTSAATTARTISGKQATKIINVAKTYADS
ncbi:MAG: hypothetical protein WCR95_08430, partial [Eubacteriales bacterium]